MEDGITKTKTKFRKPIPADEKLAVALGYLATGETFESLMYQFRIHRSTIVVPHVCEHRTDGSSRLQL